MTGNVSRGVVLLAMTAGFLFFFVSGVRRRRAVFWRGSADSWREWNGGARSGNGVRVRMDSGRLGLARFQVEGRGSVDSFSGGENQ